MTVPTLHLLHLGFMIWPGLLKTAYFYTNPAVPIVEPTRRYSPLNLTGFNILQKRASEISHTLMSLHKGTLIQSVMILNTDVHEVLGVFCKVREICFWWLCQTGDRGKAENSKRLCHGGRMAFARFGNLNGRPCINSVAACHFPILNQHHEE